MSNVTVTSEVDLPPHKVAELFWQMDAEQQTDFFAALERMAGISLCFQMAHVVREIAKRADRGDYSAQNGFQTMLNHAKDYCESATDIRSWSAEREIRRMADAARATH